MLKILSSPPPPLETPPYPHRLCGIQDIHNSGYAFLPQASDSVPLENGFQSFRAQIDTPTTTITPVSTAAPPKTKICQNYKPYPTSDTTASPYEPSMRGAPIHL